MKHISGYRIIEQLSKHQKSEVYRAVDKNNSPVILKVLCGSELDLNDIALMKKEYQIMTHLSSDLLIRPLELVSHEDLPVIVLEDIGGISLREHMKTMKHGPSFLKNTLEIAILAIKAISEIHHKNIIHKDINPSNFIYNPKTGRLNLIDFGMATDLSFERAEQLIAIAPEGTFSYISPEQTGRMNRNIDYRTDYYSLGISLYEIFLGRLPFRAETPREWIHCHIAKKAIPLMQAGPHIPESLSDVVMKLIEKTPEERYQSAFGLLSDINHCYNELVATGDVPRFAIGAKDVPQKFSFPQKLYGREKEIETLIKAFESSNKFGASCMLLKGYTGIGKSSLVGEIYGTISELNGYFITGSFDPQKRDVPYYAIIQAFSSLIQSLMTESEEDIENWKSEIMYALAGNAQLVINVIPELELILGAQPEPTQLLAIEAQNRFIIAFQSFVEVFSHAEHPLVLFLDNLQWADSASLEMLRNILVHAKENSIFCIGAYREHEIDENHPLNTFKESIQSIGIISYELEVTPLSEDDIQQLLTDSFACSMSEAIDFATVCHKKTNGNPFFLNEFLTDLYKRKEIHFDPIKGKWMWDIHKIEKNKVTENVVELLSNRFDLLAPATQVLLRYASCIGTRFDLKMLSSITKQPANKVLADLKEALNESLVVPLGESYRFAEFYEDQQLDLRFLHEKIQQVAYSQIDEETKKTVHLQIARLLTAGLSEKAIEEDIFDIVEHFNHGRSLLERFELPYLAELNLKASNKSKITGAFQTAHHYLKLSLSLIDSEIWDTDYQLALRIYTDAAESAYLCGLSEEVDLYSQIVIDQSQALIDQTGVREIRVLSLYTQKKQDQAIKETFDFLEQIGVHFPKKAGNLRVVGAILRTTFLLMPYKNKKEISFPEVKDPHVAATMRIMGVMVYPLYGYNPTLFAYMICRLIHLTVKYGAAPISPLCFMLYGMILNVMGRIQRGYDYGQLGMKLLRELNAKRHWAEISCCNNLGVRIWKEPISLCTSGLIEDYKTALEIGDIEFAVSSLASCSNYLFYSGTPLTEIMATAAKYKKSISHLPPTVGMIIMDMQLQANNILQTPGSSYNILTGDYFDEKKFLAQENFNNASITLNLYLLKTILAYTFGDYKKAMRMEKEGRKFKQGVAGILHYAMFTHFQSLSLLANFNKMGRIQKALTILKVRSNQRAMKKWADHAPMNFMNKYLLVEAEIHRVRNNWFSASSLYDKAIELAQEQEFLHDQAIAYELAGKFWLDHKKNDIAAIYLRKAHTLYKIWGAEAKVTMMDQEHKDLLEHKLDGTENHIKDNETTHSSQSNSSAIDIETIMDAAKNISGEIVLPELIKKTMKIILEHAGARRGALLLMNTSIDKLQVKAEGLVYQTGIKVSLKDDDVSKRSLPITLIRYVERTGQAVILHNACKEGNFVTDSYIQLQHSMSVLALPIQYQGRLTGVLYLENNIAANVFTKRSVNVLNMLSAQVAISIENALLYEEQERKVSERTAEIQIKKTEIERKNTKLTDSIKYANRIQEAMMPRNMVLDEAFADNFIFLRPRDIVSGDFYWFKKKDNLLLIAAADCTGHGVPGALMSMLGVSLLNDIVSRDITQPAEILNELRVKIKDSLHQNLDTENKSLTQDGIDIAFCTINIETLEMQFAGAYNPVYIIRNHELIEIKGDRMPIGVHPKDDNGFNPENFQLQKNDSIYLFSDGYYSQFGGPKSEKMKHTRFKEHLLSIQDFTMQDQKRRLENKFEDWKGMRDQVDDILVIGIKV